LSRGSGVSGLFDLISRFGHLACLIPLRELRGERSNLLCLNCPSLPLADGADLRSQELSDGTGIRIDLLSEFLGCDRCHLILSLSSCDQSIALVDEISICAA